MILIITVSNLGYDQTLANETDIEVGIDHDNLSDEETDSLQELLQDHSYAFAHSKREAGKANTVKHSIDVEPNQRPRRCVPFRANPQEREIIKEEIDKCLENDIIRSSTSPWSGLVITVTKPDGTHSFCVDYRKLNNVTKSNVYPLPRIDDAHDSLGGAKPTIFCTLDLQSRYWQVETSEDSKECTAFTTHCSL